MSATQEDEPARETPGVSGVDARIDDEAQRADLLAELQAWLDGAVLALSGLLQLLEAREPGSALSTTQLRALLAPGVYHVMRAQGYTDGLARDVLEDLKRDYYDEIDNLQDTHAFEYEAMFRIELLLQGIVAGPVVAVTCINFSENYTDRGE